MAKLEIPSIIVQSGVKGMERSVRTQRTLSKQEGIDEDIELNNYETNNKSSAEQTNNKGQLQGQMSVEETPHQQAQPPAQNGNLHRSRSQNKVKLLVRSHAVREETSPPPEPTQEPTKQESRRHKDWQPPLSRGNSREQQYDGGNQVDLHQFIVDTLNRNHKDRMLLLKIENELVNLANDPKRTMHKFAQMSSYQRMLVHRVAAYFSMEHNVDTSGVAVIVNTTKSTRIPDTRFRDFVRDDLLLPEEPRRSILKRDSSSFDETGSYKIEGEIDCIDDFQWENDENGVFTNDCDQNNQNQRNGRLLKVESYESGDTLRANSLRLSVSKSHSFNGYESQQQPQHHSPSTRVLTKQDSGSSMSSRISPSSSGYKSQRSDATLSATPSPTATPNLHTQLSSQSTTCALSPEPEAVVWAVSDLSSVPPGSVLIHPQSGQPYTNPDGSIYHYDPSNPPRMIADNNSGAQVTNTPQGSQSPAKHEGCEIVQNKIENGYEAQYLPPAQQYTQSLEPQQIQFHPVYPPQPPHHYQHRVQESMNGADLSQYMVGLSLDGSRQPGAHIPSDGRHLYWPPHHIQAQPQGGTVYYTAPGGGQRYPPLAPPQPYIAPPPPQQHPPPEHPGNCYGGGYPASECIPYAPSAVHMYYTPTPYNSVQANGSHTNGGHSNTGYYGNMTTCSAPILAVQYPQPCAHPSSPHTPQGVCGQFAVYNGCYPGQYSQPTASLPVPAQLFRKPALQVGVRCGSPLRTQYPASPTVKDRSQDDKLQPLPLYGFRVLPGDMRLLGNAGRLPFTLQPPPKPAHARKHRSKMGGRPQESYHTTSKA
ncbi:cAMP-regulated phosphoprotein 21 isoform X4 [Halyomorpha halys]|uniref:cAMP-regulated phosphoprotein 21 isoform X4 n=1 Tax=Halyomorpha halys TaxID=286706 RepID=UPI0006D4D4B2